MSYMKTMKFLFTGVFAMAVAGGAAAVEPAGRWPVEKANAWAKGRPWYCGFNHVPANAINDVEIWAKETFSPELIRSEFKIASGLGFNCVRIFLQYKVYENDPGWFLCAFDKYLALADEAGLQVMPVLFDDCKFSPMVDPFIGKQPDPLPGWGMWAWVPSPGYTMVVDTRTHGRLEKYVKDVISLHRDDKRVFVWDLYNEPTFATGEYSDYSLALLRKSFRWAREVNPSQPLTAGKWNGDRKLNDILLSESDIITFHCYFTPDGTRKVMKDMCGRGRPVICTEWLYRTSGCNVDPILNIYKEAGVGCMLWGLVTGKTQLQYPNGRLDVNFKGKCKSDLFSPDLVPYDAKEIELIKKATGKIPAKR